MPDVLLAVGMVALCLPPSELSVLFLGNSHTRFNDLPQMVERLLEADGSKRQVAIKMVTSGLLNDMAGQDSIRREVGAGHGIVVLQGAMLSSSHKYKYTQEGAISLAKLAKKAGSRPILFAEWPRHGWNESGYIMGIYRQIAKSSGAEIAPVCIAWDEALRKGTKLELWAGDGNHSSATGAYLAACTIYFRIVGNKGRIAWSPAGMPKGVAQDLARAARVAVTRL